MPKYHIEFITIAKNVGAVFLKRASFSFSQQKLVTDRERFWHQLMEELTNFDSGNKLAISNGRVSQERTEE